LPFNKLHVPKDLSADTCHAFNNLLHENLVDTCGVNPEDYFCVIQRYAQEENDSAHHEVRRCSTHFILWHRTATRYHTTAKKNNSGTSLDFSRQTDSAVSTSALLNFTACDGVMVSN